MHRTVHTKRARFILSRETGLKLLKQARHETGNNCSLIIKKYFNGYMVCRSFVAYLACSQRALALCNQGPVDPRMVSKLKARRITGRVRFLALRFVLCW